MPKAIYIDYQRFENGGSRDIDYYDSFFQDLKTYNKRLAKLIYRIVFFIVNTLSKYKISLSFVEDYKNHAFDDKREEF